MSDQVTQWGVVRPDGPWPPELAVAGAGSLDEKAARLIARSHGSVAVSRTVTYGEWSELPCDHGSYWTDPEGLDHCLVCPHVSQPSDPSSEGVAG